MLLGSITIRNDTNKEIVLCTKIKEASKSESYDKEYKIAPKEYQVFFTDRIESISWTK